MTTDKLDYKKYEIELAARDDFEILIADNDEEIFDIADKLEEGYLNIWEIDDNYEKIRKVI